MASRHIESRRTDEPEGAMERTGRVVVFLVTPSVAAGALLLGVAIGLARLIG